VSEWLKEQPWKGCVGLALPRVRIPPSPFFLHDNNRCYSEGFDIILKNTGLEPVRTPYEAPNASRITHKTVRCTQNE
jgi:hypothetical protein